MNPNQHLGSSQRGIALFFTFLMALLLPALAGAQLSVSVSGTNPTCNGFSNGAVTANVNGGVGPFSYQWNNGANSSTVLGLSAGTFSVTVTDANGSQANASTSLTAPAAVVASISVSNPCTAPGNATASATGGTGSYTYSWDTGATSANVTGLPSGLRCVTVTDNNGCADVECIAVSGVMNLNLLVQGLACFNFCDASIEAIVTGGTAPFTYNWSNGATTSVNPNLGPGTFSVTVTDVNGCTVSGTTSVGNPVQINVGLSTTNPACGGGGSTVGSASVSPSGGTAPYTVLWSTGSTLNSISGLVPGSYSVTITDFVGCAQTASFNIVSQSNLALNASATPSASCGSPTGSASVAVSGGVAPFTYLWNNGATTATASGLAPGTYSVVVTDAQGCGATAQATVGGTPAIALDVTGVSGGCAANGSANAMVTPGTGTAPFSFLWNTGATTSIVNNLTAGNYSVTVTDASGCTAVDQITVTGTSNITATATGTAAACFGQSNGSATVTAGGASAPFTYQWSNGATSQTINNLSTGTYFVTVTHSASGCTAFTSAFVSQPTQVNVSVTGVNGACNTLGSATAVATGGTPGFTYAWSNGSTGATISNLNSGAYAVTATDTRGCAAMGMVSISNSTAGLNVTINITQAITAPNAANGAVSTTVSGGTAPYTYAWNTGATTSSLSGLGGGTYTVTVTSANGCTGTATVQLTEPSCIGDKVWLDVDRDGCQDPGETGVSGVTVTLTGTATGGGAVSMTMVTALNGQYQFNNLQPGTYQVQFGLPTGFAFSPANACSDDFSDSDVNASGNTGNINLVSGNCNVTVDAGIFDNCVNVTNPGVICCNQVLCGPGNDAAPITVTTPASGGGSPIQYMWMYTNVAGPYNPNTWFPVQTGGMGATYDPGLIYETTYFVRCVKAAACSDWLESNIVEIAVGDDAVAEITGIDHVCVGDQAQYFAANSGTGATYSWNFGPWATPSTSTSQNPIVTWNQAGIVYITLSVTNNGCTSTDQLGVAISNSPIICGNGLVINVGEVSSSVMVEWEMERMEGNYEYSVQRSVDGETYVELARMQQAQAEGLHNYAFADYFPKKGNAFYRVEIINDGEHMLYSDAKLMQRFAKTQNFLIHPNPIADQLTIEANDNVQTATKIEVMNLQGKLVELIKIGEGEINKTLSFGHLNSGTYLLRMSYNNGQREVIKFVKE